MLAIISDPMVWLGAAGVVGACTAGLVCNLFAQYVWKQSEPEPKFDFAKLQSELDTLFAPLPCRV